MPCALATIAMLLCRRHVLPFGCQCWFPAAEFNLSQLYPTHSDASCALLLNHPRRLGRRPPPFPRTLRGHGLAAVVLEGMLHDQRTKGIQPWPAASSPRFTPAVSRIPARQLAAGALQTPLASNKPGDAQEQAASRLAEQVMRRPKPRLQRACAWGGTCPKRTRTVA
jgi:hypothetical protein